MKRQFSVNFLGWGNLLSGQTLIEMAKIRRCDPWLQLTPHRLRQFLLEDETSSLALGERLSL